MTTKSWSRDSERRWRHLSNWLWLAPVVWSVIGGTWYAMSKNLEGPGELLFLPWWVLVGGILAYVLAAISARWGRVPVIALLLTGLVAGVGIWFLAGIHAAVWCGLITPLMIGTGCLRLPPWESPVSSSAVIGVALGMIEPVLILAFLLAAALLMVHHNYMDLPGWYWWWVVGVVSGVLLICSLGLHRRWRRQARAACQPDSDPNVVDANCR